jgi:drug/metabolite transporter (DMT)-like permease
VLQPRAHRAASTRRVWAALVTVYVVWGSTYLAIRYAVVTIPPLLMGGARFVAAGAALFAWDRWSGSRSGEARVRDRSERGRGWLGALLIGGLLLLGGNGCVVWGEAHHVPSGISALIFATLPMWMALLSFLLYRERLSAAVIGGLVLGFAGTALLVENASSGSSGWVGPLVVLGGAFCWSLGSVLTRWAPLPERQMRSTAMQMLCGGGLLALAGLVSGEAGDLHYSSITASSWTAFVYLILIGSLVGFTAYTWLLPNARLSLVSTYAYVNPVVALFLGWAIASEPITLRTFAASAIVIAAVVIIVTARARAGPSETLPPDASDLAQTEHP